MCQLMGIICNYPTSPKFSFTELRKRGGGRRFLNHSDGWGLAWFQNGRASVVKEPVPAYRSPLAAQIQCGEYPIQSRVIIGHIRTATKGAPIKENTHPFKEEMWGCDWVFAHNGILDGIFNEPLRNFMPNGKTDSEWAFCYIMDRLFYDCSPDDPVSRIREVIKEAAEYLSSKYGTLNFLMSEGEHLFAFGDGSLYYTKREYRENHSITLIDADWNIQVPFLKQVGEVATIIATKPLTREETWLRIKGLKVFS